MAAEDAKGRARVFKALGHPLRLQIVHALQRGEMMLGDLVPLAGINQSNLSRHIGVLKQAGLVRDRRVGICIALRLATPSILDAFDPAVQVIRSDHLHRSREMPVTPA